MSVDLILSFLEAKSVDTDASENTIKAYAETGVDFISVGALTHHVKSLDMSLKAF